MSWASWMNPALVVFGLKFPHSGWVQITLHINAKCTGTYGLYHIELFMGAKQLTSMDAGNGANEYTWNQDTEIKNFPVIKNRIYPIGFKTNTGSNSITINTYSAYATIKYTLGTYSNDIASTEPFISGEEYNQGAYVVF